jgi:hypothetical protein
MKSPKGKVGVLPKLNSLPPGRRGTILGILRWEHHR